MRMWHAVMLVVLVISGTAAFAAAPPKTISYQGYLKDAAGKPVSAPTGLAFRLYSTTSGVNPVWTESQNVSPVNGVYSVELGSVTPMNFYRGQQFYLGVKAGSDPEMRPLQKLAAVPYSLALSLPLYQSITSPSAALYITNSTGPAFQGTSDQPNMYAIYGRNHYGTGVTGESQFQTGVYGSSVSSGTGVWGWSQDGTGIKGGNSSSTASTMELINYNNTLGSLLLRGQAGSSPATVFQVTTAGKVIANGVQSTNTAGYGVYGSSSADYGVWGQSSSNAGVYGSSVNSHGVYGENTGAASGIAGVLGRASNTTGTTYGLLGMCDSFTSYAVQGTHVPTSNYGYLGSNGAGAYGRHSATGNAGTSGSSAAGIVGYAPGANGIGVWGKGQLASGVGVKAEGGGTGITATNLTNTAVGVSLATTANAGEFTGDVVVKGNIKREYAAGVNNNVTPVAFGMVGNNSVIYSGTGNFTVTWNATSSRYEIAITGEQLVVWNYTVIITPASNATPRIATYDTLDGKIDVYIFDVAGNKVQNSFSFMVYRQ